MQFPQALEAVLQTLERMRDERAYRPCVSRSVLDALNRVATFRTSGNVRETKLDPPSPSLRRPGIDKIEQLASVQSRVRACTKCPNLASTRTQTVFGVGNPDAEIMFIGEAPGADEDAQGGLHHQCSKVSPGRASRFVWKSPANTARNANLPPVFDGTNRHH